jgi:hypothetical protein
MKSNSSGSPHLDLVIRLLRRALCERPGNIAEIASTSVVACAEVLGLAPVFRYSSVDYPAQGMRGQQRILDICERSGAGTYINMAGGRKLYSREVFSGRSIGLQFLSPDASVWAQGVRRESVLGLLLRDGPQAVRSWLGRYTLD